MVVPGPGSQIPEGLEKEPEPSIPEDQASGAEAATSLLCDRAQEGVLRLVICNISKNKYAIQ